MRKQPYTIRIYVPDGDPQGVRVIDRMNWTGVGIVFPRTNWQETRNRREFDRAGVYILVGRSEEDEDLPRVYIGEGDGVRNRIDSHLQGKDFWNWAVAFFSNSSGLNKAHVQWLEYALVGLAQEAKQCVLDNANTPQKPALAEHEEADVQGFLQEMLQILPLVEMRAFEKPKPIVANSGRTATQPRLPDEAKEAQALDTVVVPAQQEGFERVFLGENSWHAIRIAGAMLDKIKYIAAYQTHPVSAVTHVARVKQIEPYGDNGKYKLIFEQAAKPISPIPFADAPTGSMQGPRYTAYAKLQTAKKVTDLF
jgi:hypothetical protein